jgi:uncharacterized protein YbaA (DUF1428 family)
VTMDGRVHNVGKWDMLIAHPPCTYLSNVATRFFSLKCTEPEKVVERWRERAYGAVRDALERLMQSDSNIHRGEKTDDTKEM